MEVLFWILFGTISGWIAYVIFESPDQNGFFKDILLGILGAVFAGLLTNALGYHGLASYNAISVLSASIFIMALIGGKRVIDINFGKGVRKYAAQKRISEMV